MVGHPVRHDAARLRRGCNHVPAGAHTEGIGRAAAWQLHVQLVIRRAKPRRVCKRAILVLVDLPLRVLDAHAHGKRLRLHRYPGAVQCLKRIAGAVPDGKQDAGGRKHRLAVCALYADGCDAAVFGFDAGQPCAEADLAAVVQDFLPQVLHDRDQLVRADVGLCVVQNIRAGSGLGELLQNPADALVLDAGIQLSV